MFCVSEGIIRLTDKLLICVGIIELMPKREVAQRHVVKARADARQCGNDEDGGIESDRRLDKSVIL